MMVYTLLPTLINMTLTASVAILLVLVARLLMKKAPKVIAYALWGIVLIRLLCPVSIESPVSIMPQFDRVDQYVQTAGQVDQPIVNVPANPENVVTDPGDDVVVSDYEQDPQVTVKAAPNWSVIAAYGWMAGILAMAVYAGFSTLRLRRRLLVAMPLRDNILLVDGLSSPFVMGLLRPKIYLPSSLTEQERTYIILHEQHHIRRGDHIFKALAFLALTVHWFNPLVWVAFIAAGKDMEMSCDEAVVKKLGDGIRADYTASLLSLATGRRIIAGMPLAFGEGDPKGRIRNLANRKKPAFWVILAAVIACAVLAVCLLTNPAGSAPSPEENKGTPLSLQKDEDYYREALKKWRDLGFSTVFSDRETLTLNRLTTLYSVYDLYTGEYDKRDEALPYYSMETLDAFAKANYGISAYTLENDLPEGRYDAEKGCVMKPTARTIRRGTATYTLLSTGDDGEGNDWLKLRIDHDGPFNELLEQARIIELVFREEQGEIHFIRASYAPNSAFVPTMLISPQELPADLQATAVQGSYEFPGSFGKEILWATETERQQYEAFLSSLRGADVKKLVTVSGPSDETFTVPLTREQAAETLSLLRSACPELFDRPQNPTTGGGYELYLETAGQQVLITFDGSWFVVEWEGEPNSWVFKGENVAGIAAIWGPTQTVLEEEAQPRRQELEQVQRMYGEESALWIKALEERLSLFRSGQAVEVANHHPAYPADFPDPALIPPITSTQDFLIIQWNPAMADGNIIFIAKIDEQHYFIAEPAISGMMDGTSVYGFGNSAFWWLGSNTDSMPDSLAAYLQDAYAYYGGENLLASAGLLG